MVMLNDPKPFDDSELVDEGTLIQLLKLDKRPNIYASRRALDRLWKLACNVHRDKGLAPLRRIMVGRRYLYEVDIIKQFREALAVYT